MLNERILAWLGQWRDHLPPDAVAALQEIVAPAIEPLPSWVATTEEWEELSAIERMRANMAQTLLDNIALTAAPQLGAEPGRLPVDVRPTEAQLERVHRPIGVAHFCDRNGPMIPINGEYRLTCSACGASQITSATV